MRVQVVNAQAGKGVRVDVDCPLSADFAHHNVWCDVTGVKGRILCAGSRIKAANEKLRVAQLAVVAIGVLLQFDEIACSKQIEVLAYNNECQRLCFVYR